MKTPSTVNHHHPNSGGFCIIAFAVIALILICSIVIIGIISMAIPPGNKADFKATFGVRVPESEAELSASRPVVLKHLQDYTESNTVFAAEISMALDKANNYPTKTVSDLETRASLFENVEQMKAHIQYLTYRLEDIQKLAYAGGFTKEAESLGTFDHDIGKLTTLDDWNY
jgi:hypothetical protein